MQSVFIVVMPDDNEVEFILPMHRPIGRLNEFVAGQLGLDPRHYRLQDDTTRYVLPLDKTLADYFAEGGGMLRLRYCVEDTAHHSKLPTGSSYLHGGKAPKQAAARHPVSATAGLFDQFIQPPVPPRTDKRAPEPYMSGFERNAASMAMGMAVAFFYGVLLLAMFGSQRTENTPMDSSLNQFFWPQVNVNQSLADAANAVCSRYRDEFMQAERPANVEVARPEFSVEKPQYVGDTADVWVWWPSPVWVNGVKHEGTSLRIRLVYENRRWVVCDEDLAQGIHHYFLARYG